MIPKLPDSDFDASNLGSGDPACGIGETFSYLKRPFSLVSTDEGENRRKLLKSITYVRVQLW